MGLFSRKAQAAPVLSDVFEASALARFMEVYDVADSRRVPRRLGDIHGFPSAIFMDAGTSEPGRVRGQCFMLFAARAGQDRSGPLYRLSSCVVDVDALASGSGAGQEDWRRIEHFLKRQAIPSEILTGKAIVLGHDQNSFTRAPIQMPPAGFAACLSMMRDFERQMRDAGMKEVFYPVFYRDYPIMEELDAMAPRADAAQAARWSP